MHPSTEIFFAAHGGGPLPLLGDPGHREMVTLLEQIAADIKRPSSILIISAHWEEDRPVVTANATPELIYDYYGFPPESYRIQYPCVGSTGLANKVHTALRDAGLDASLDAERGLDHGVFVPLKLMYPAADIPCVQLSLLANLDPEQHLAMGRALAAVDEEGLLVIGSGFSFHNLQAMRQPDTPETRADNEAFQSWLVDACSDPLLTVAEREALLVDWESAPHARFCHPREEHLLPLHVCAGMAGRASDTHWRLKVLGKESTMFYWTAQANVSASTIS